jgi:Flp pilus assembly protein TadG
MIPAERNTNALRHHAARFLRDEDGVALVEFAVVLPMMLLVLAIIFEGTRLLLSYQAAISGVRDATRFLSRVVPATVCASGGSVSGYAARLQTIVSQSMSGRQMMPTAVTVNSVTPSLSCVSGGYRINPAPVATVTASITITFPWAGVFTLTGGSAPTLTKTITDQARIFGT